MRNNKMIIIVISIILALAIAGSVLAYLFVATDTFKSSRELFGKYFVQELEVLDEIIDLKTIQVYQNLKNENKYESTTNVQMIYSEGGEISNPLNDLSLKLDVQKDDEKEYFYGDIQILYKDEECLESEIIKDQQKYGVRFTDVFKQFITIDQEEDIKSLANDIGIDVNILEVLVEIMEGNIEIISQEKIDEAKNKYLNIITTEIANGTFKKQKNAMITHNGATTKTNAYSVSLTSEQVERILNQIRDNTSEEIEVSTAKITVYERKRQAIRMVIESDENKITLENIERDGRVAVKINYLNSSNEKMSEYNAEISKTNFENKEKFEVIVNILDGEDESSINIVKQMQLVDNKIEVELELSHKQDITTTSVKLENTTTKGNDFGKTQTLTTDNYKSLSSISDKNKRQQIINSVKEIVLKEMTQKIGTIMVVLGLPSNENEEVVQQEISQADINKFNTKFEFYTGEEVSVENIKMLLNIVKENCSGHTIMSIGPTEEIENPENVETKSIITLYIEEGSTNEESITKVLEELDDNKKYKVLISYKELNGLIEYITITEI